MRLYKTILRILTFWEKTISFLGHSNSQKPFLTFHSFCLAKSVKYRPETKSFMSIGHVFIHESLWIQLLRVSMYFISFARFRITRIIVWAMKAFCALLFVSHLRLALYVPASAAAGSNTSNVLVLDRLWSLLSLRNELQKGKLLF